MDALRTAFAKILSDYWLPIHPKVRKAFVFVLVGLIAVVVALTSLSSSPNSVKFEPSKASSVTTAKVLVHIAGGVVHPGVYELATGARVKDAVLAAGGFTKLADQTSVNLAREIADGEQILVQQNGSSKTEKSSTGKINLNKAQAAELEKLPGIGPALAARIIDYRLANGSFKSINDLRKVSGIGVKLVARIKDEITF